MINIYIFLIFLCYSPTEPVPYVVATHPNISTTAINEELVVNCGQPALSHAQGNGEGTLYPAEITFVMWLMHTQNITEQYRIKIFSNYTHKITPSL